MAKESKKPESGGPISTIGNIISPAFPGIRSLWRRFGGRKPPRYDPTKTRVWYRPCSRVYSWYGAADLHTTDPCILPHCDRPDETGRHSEVRPDGFEWCGRQFSCLVEALENQAFTRWYEEGWFEGEEVEKGKDVMKKGKMVLRPPLYGADEEPPLPKYNFFLHEHLDEMTSLEIRVYKSTGEVPKRLRRRGRSRPGGKS